MPTLFKKKFALEQRKQESRRIRARYPDRIPVIVEKDKHSKNVPDIDKHKYLVPGDLTIGQFVYVIRKRISLPPEKALFIFINNIMPPTSQLMEEIASAHHEEDGFLYIKYSGENTFG